MPITGWEELLHLPQQDIGGVVCYALRTNLNISADSLRGMGFEVIDPGRDLYKDLAHDYDITPRYIQKWAERKLGALGEEVRALYVLNLETGDMYSVDDVEEHYSDTPTYVGNIYREIWRSAGMFFPETSRCSRNDISQRLENRHRFVLLDAPTRTPQPGEYELDLTPTPTGTPMVLSTPESAAPQNYASQGVSPLLIGVGAALMMGAIGAAFVIRRARKRAASRVNAARK